VASTGEGRGVYRVSGGMPEVGRPLGRPSLRWEYNNELELREIGLGGANWIRLSHDRVQWCGFANTVMNLQIP